MKIQEVAERTHLGIHTLRYYEQIGLLPEASRSPAGYRMYDHGTLDRLAVSILDLIGVAWLQRRGKRPVNCRPFGTGAGN